MSETLPDEVGGWFSHEELTVLRHRLPFLYVDVVPVRVNTDGVITRIATLLRTPREGSIQRALVSGRVMYHERLRDAIARHIDKDLGSMALPRIPTSLVPFTVAEYFPTPGITPYHDPRQHAVSLAYIVPVDGDCQPSHDALEVAWHSPEEIIDPTIIGDMVDGHSALVRTALATTGRLL
ncbi:MAG TPA: DUF4916 domain-containing protein [Beutenbergiaceae bacterium]|nr:DUF4916 domain-containing protein [Beutenbergiaceae bacterium]